MSVQSSAIPWAKPVNGVFKFFNDGALSCIDSKTEEYVMQTQQNFAYFNEDSVDAYNKWLWKKHPLQAYIKVKFGEDKLLINAKWVYLASAVGGSVALMMLMK